MAILKHIASKNANYGSAIDYLKYQHDEFHLVPVLDESGNMLLREEFYLDGLNCHPETFDLECELLNQQYHKNNTYDEIKSHHYIISHDPRDNADHDLTGERAQAIGLEYAKANFPGHQALVCTHTDGNNGTGNIPYPHHNQQPAQIRYRASDLHRTANRLQGWLQAPPYQRLLEAPAKIFDGYLPARRAASGRFALSCCG